jgi:5-methylcytosine-specific restriction endonuclease McrA
MENFREFPCGCRFRIKENGKFDFKIKSAPDCPAVWSLLSRGLTKGIFQLESNLGKHWCKELKPESLEHLTALGSILRPGSLENRDENGISTTQHYCLRKNGLEPAKVFHSSLEKILKSSYALMIFQEQSMEVAKEIAGFNLQEADELRKAIGKKISSLMADVRVKFLEGCNKVGILTSEEANSLFDQIEKSQRYSFNRCISADTVIQRFMKNGYSTSHGNGYTVEELYRIKNDINYAKKTGHLSLYKKFKLIGHYSNGLSLNEDGRIRKNLIKDIQYAGKRPVYKIVTESGKYIKVTNNHKFPTPDGIKLCCELTTENKLYISGKYEKCKNKYTFSGWTIEEIRTKRTKHDNKTVGFMKGENNPGYTTGTYSEYLESIKTLPNYCEECGVEGEYVRLEIHHIDKNRANNKRSNLIKLCVSCHKKADYALGRTKQGEKGYPVLTEKIVSIEYIGVEDVYDVTMEAPNHTFVTGTDIVTCNSHAFCYSKGGYLAAYAKAHFPLHFFKSYLKFSHEKQKPLQEVRELVNEAKLMDIQVLGPSILHLKKNFWQDGQRIYFGLSDVKKVGDKEVFKIQNLAKDCKEITGRDLKDFSFYHFLLFLSDYIRSEALENWIKVGAFSYVNKSRNTMLAEYNAWNSLTDGEKKFMRNNCNLFPELIPALHKTAPKKCDGGGAHNVNRSSLIQSAAKLLENPPTSLDDSPNWIATQEEKLLGIALTCSRIDACDTSDVNTTCKEFNLGQSRQDCIFAVEVKNVKELVTKRGKNPGQAMAQLTVEDHSGSLQMTAFPNVWEEYSGLLTEENTVVIMGYKDKKTGGAIINKVFQI